MAISSGSDNKCILCLHFTYSLCPTYAPCVAGLVLLERGDGARGWVPASCVRELPSDHMRARHFKQRYQFLKALAELDMAPSEP